MDSLRLRNSTANQQRHDKKIAAEKSLQEMFNGSLEPSVVNLILSESDYNVEDAIEKLITLSSSNPVNASKHDSLNSFTPMGNENSYPLSDKDPASDAKFSSLSYDAIDAIDLIARQEAPHGSLHVHKPTGGVKKEVSSVGKKLADSADNLVNSCNGSTAKLDRKTEHVSSDSEHSESFKEFMRNFISANPQSNEWNSKSTTNVTYLDDDYHTGQRKNDNKETQESKYGSNMDFTRTSKMNTYFKNDDSTMNDSTGSSLPGANEHGQHFQNLQQSYPNSPNVNSVSQPSVQSHPNSFGFAHSNNYLPPYHQLRPQPEYFNGPNQAFRVPRPRYQVPKQIISPGQGNYGPGQGRLPPGFASSHFISKPRPRKPAFQLPNGKVLVIMRGLPGSGKSTFARSIKGSGEIFSTDEYFMRSGQYQFNVENLGQAHEWNQWRARQAMEQGVSPVIIDNTNVQAWQMKPYVAMAQRLGYQVIFKEPDTPWKWSARELYKRNQHGVSISQIRNMMDHYEHDLTVEHVLKSYSLDSKPREEVSPASKIHQKNSSLPQGDSGLCKSTSEGVNEEKPGDLTEQQSSCMQREISERKERNYEPRNREKSEERQPVTKPVINLTSNRKQQSQKSNNYNIVAKRKARNELLSDRAHGSRSPVEEFEQYMADERKATKDTEREQKNDDEGKTFSPKPQRKARKRDRNTSIEKQAPEVEACKLTDAKKEVLTLESIESSGLVKPEDSRGQYCFTDSQHDKDEDSQVESQSSTKSSSLEFERTGVYVHENSESFVQTSKEILSASYQQDIETKQVLQESYMNSESENKDSSGQLSSFTNFPSGGEDSDDVTVESDDSDESSISSNGAAGQQSDSTIAKNALEIINEPLNEDKSIKSMATVASSPKNTESSEGKDVSSQSVESSEDSDSDMTGFEFLNTCFPDINDKTIVGILSGNGGDVNKAIEIILNNIEIFTNPKPDPANSNSYSSDSSTDDGIPLTSSQAASSPAALSTKANHGSFQMTIEPAVAFHLFEMFGPINGVDFKGEFSSNDLSITADLEFSKLLYQQWAKSIQTRKLISRSSCQTPQARSPKSPKKHIKQRTRIPVVLRDPLPPPPKHTSKPADLREIMHEQLALEQSRREQEERESDDNLAVVLKRQKLYAMFPGVDPSALEEIFAVNRYELEPTVRMVQASCDIEAKPTFLLQDEISHIDEQDWSHFVTPEKKEHSFQALDSPGYLDFRGEANMHYKLREECFKKAAVAFAQKQGQLAQFYAQQGHRHTEKIKEANDRAATKILEHKNAENNPYVLDLHGLHVSEALQALEERLNPSDAVYRPRFISVVTGRGLHSKQGKPKIKPAVLEFLQKQNYRYEETHAGQLKVFLN